MISNKAHSGLAQLSFHFEHDNEFLSNAFEKTVGRPVTLILTDNSTSMLSVSRKDSGVCVRLHRIFLRADEMTLSEIAAFIRHGRGKMPKFRSFIKEMSSMIPQKTRRTVSTKTLGNYHDLQAIFEKLNKEYFDGKISSLITWGTRKSSKRVVRKRTLGSYNSQTDTIRINPVLDKSTAPDYYIAFVVYHEMLHAAIGIREKAGRRTVHTRAFKERERLFKAYEQAVRWEKINFK